MSSTVDKIKNFLKDHKVLTLSYISEGKPRCCALWYASDDDLNLYYLSALSTNHGGTLRNGGNIAYTIHKDDQNWQEITGIQGRGQVSMVESSYGWDQYTKKFPFVENQFTTLKKALEETKLWRISSNWIRLIDNRVAFGHKEEIELN